MVSFAYTLESPSGRLASGEAKACILPTVQGQVTILPGHTPCVLAVGAGACVCVGESGEEVFAVAGGIVEVLKGGAVRALVELAEHAQEETAKVEEAVRRAKEDMAKAATKDDEDFARLAAALERELARLRASVRVRRGGR